VLVFEDLHWGDAPSVEFVDAALRTLRGRPLLVLALGRPEVDDKFAKLWPDRDLQRVALPGLSVKACRRLVRHALGEIVEDQATRIIERADGNPLYLEELLRAVGAGADLVEGAVPNSVLGMVQMRFDALGSEAKRVLRAASVFGQTFRSTGVKALLGDKE